MKQSCVTQECSVQTVWGTGGKEKQCVAVQSKQQRITAAACRSSAQWSRLLNATVPAGLMAVAGLGSNPGLEGSFSARLD